MAHMIDVSSIGRASMAFVGETPWHGLGVALTEGASLAQWTDAAGFNWEALTAVPQFTRADGSVATYGDKRIIYRSDTGAPLSIMGDRYNIVQPREVLGFFENLIKGGDFHLHTAGVLNGGRRLWALAKNGHGGEIVKGDRVDQFLMLATSLDGTTPTIASFTAVRVVCANTIALALYDARRHLSDAAANIKTGKPAKAVKVNHRTTFDADLVHEQMQLAGGTWEQFQQQATRLADTRVDMGEARDLLRQVFGDPVQKSGRKAKQAADAAAATIEAAQQAAKQATQQGADTLSALLSGPHIPKADAASEARDDLARILAKGDEREQKSVARCLELFAGEGRGAGHAGVKGTLWGLLNACTEHIDHEQGRTRDNGLSSAWFGKGADLKSDALQTLLAAAN